MDEAKDVDGDLLFVPMMEIVEKIGEDDGQLSINDIEAISSTIKSIIDNTKRVVKAQEQRVKNEWTRRIEAEHEAALLRTHTIGEGWSSLEEWRVAFEYGKGEIQDWPEVESGAFLIVLEALSELSEACKCGEDDPSPLLYVRNIGGAVRCWYKGEITSKEFVLSDMHKEQIIGEIKDEASKVTDQAGLKILAKKVQDAGGIIT